MPGKTYTGVARVLICGAGFLADAYDLFVINIVKTVMKKNWEQSNADASLVSTTALVGAILGQLFFGNTADWMGRRVIFITTCCLVVGGALLSSLVWPIGSMNIYTFLAIWRFVLGFGVGGEYPLSATITSETSCDKTRGRNIGMVFSMQGWGMLLSPMVFMVCYYAGFSYEFDWRFALAFGALPGMIAFYFRYQMAETESYEVATEATKDEHHLRTMWRNLKSHWKTVLGTAGSWFLFDITFYANGLFSSTIIEAMGLSKDLEDTINYNVYLALMALPGYYAAVLTVDRFGRKNIQMMGFFMMGALYLGMGLGFDTLKQNSALLLVLYGLTYFFSNFGPNTTTFMIPAEVFPTKVRATCHGVSAASGKLGAVIGGAVLKPFLHSHGIDNVLIACGSIAFVGLIWTIVFIPQYKGGNALVEDEVVCDDPSEKSAKSLVLEGDFKNSESKKMEA